MRNILLSLLGIVIAMALVAPAFSQTTEVTIPKQPREELFGSLTKYSVAVLRSGPKWTGDSRKQIKANITKHADQLKKLVADGKLVGAAEVIDDSEVKLVVFMKTQDEKEAASIVNDMRAVKDSVLKAEVYVVWGTRGLGAGLMKEMDSKKAGTAPAGVYYLTLLSKGKIWKEKPDEGSGALIDAHASAVLKLRKDGILKFYGAVEGSTPLRNISIVSGASAPEVKEKLAAGRLIQMGWFSPEVLSCTVASGMLP